MSARFEFPTLWHVWCWSRHYFHHYRRAFFPPGTPALNFNHGRKKLCSERGEGGISDYQPTNISSISTKLILPKFTFIIMIVYMAMLMVTISYVTDAFWIYLCLQTLTLFINRHYRRNNFSLKVANFADSGVPVTATFTKVHPRSSTGCQNCQMDLLYQLVLYDGVVLHRSK